jgi:hypothetical protein
LRDGLNRVLDGSYIARTNRAAAEPAQNLN